MENIGRNFLLKREHGRAAAFRQLETDMMSHFSVLVPDCVSFDRLIATAMDIEKFLKDNPEGASDRDPMQLLSEFLQGGNDDVQVI